ncbi:MAG: hypothetical protein OEV93_02665 [Candidatus Moranbacteria bacterium]|nr:hypothetical protein [Candidatus Moranbacteria bacterium]
MADETKRNLEPIEKSDLNMESKVEGIAPKEGEIVHAVEKEVAKEISVSEKDDAYHKILSKVQTTTTAVDEDVKKDAENMSLMQDSQSKVQNLVDLAMNKGVVHAVNVARHLNDNYVLDSLHDKLLIDEFHDALVQKGLIK